VAAGSESCSMKLDEKYAALKDKPSGIARRLMNNPEKGGDRKPSAKVAGRPPRVSKEPRVPSSKIMSVGASAESVEGAVEVEAPPSSKAEKVKAWREANPEAYAKQKREFADRRAKKRAESQ